MSRSRAVREEALRLDGHRCAICGYDGREEQFAPWVVPHHGVAEDGRKLGIGGSTEQDRVDNVVCLCSTVGGLGLPPNRNAFFGLANEGSCHQLVEDGKIIIENFDPETRTFDVLDIERRPIPHSDLWCYRRAVIEDLEYAEAIIQKRVDVERALANELEEISVRVTGSSNDDKEIAAALLKLKQGDSFKELEATAVSFPQYVASRGFDSRTAAKLVKLYEESGDEWPSGVSADDFKGSRKHAKTGKKLPQSYHYATIVGDLPSVNGKRRYEVEMDESRAENDMLAAAENGDHGLLRVGKIVRRGPYMREQSEATR